ncbi:MAG: exo-alpha-sialidase [Clostridiales bacterium]|nr:exo-alpha-sialidase [Clostridiales bacterium]
MTKIKVLDTGYIYRNPIPHVYSRNAYFPSLAQLPNGKILATMSIGQAFESADQRIYLSSSDNNGMDWSEPTQIYEKEQSIPKSQFGRINILGDQLAIIFAEYNRSRKDAGLSNPENLGFVETELALLRSDDGGDTWHGPYPLDPPLIGPSFELCTPIIELSDGRWLLQTSTWRSWDGDAPNGMKAVALVSYDKGETWPEYIDVMADIENNIIFWESRVIELADGRLLGTAWVYDENNACDRENHYALSDPNGKKFGPPKSTGLKGQTLEPILLDDGTILSFYRRTDKPGLWANLSRIEGEKWINLYEMPLWGYDESRWVSRDSDMVKNFNVLSFGAPRAIRLMDGTIYVAIWAVEECVGSIRWFRLGVEG